MQTFAKLYALMMDMILSDHLEHGDHKGSREN